MAKDGIDLKVYLQPQIENLNKAKDELGGFVKEFGDEKISQSFNKIQNRISSLGQLLNKDLSFTNFQDAGREVISLLNEMQKITLSMGNLDIIPGFNDLEQKLIGINQQIAQTETAIKKTKEGGKLDKNTGKFSFFVKEKDAQVVSKKFIREEGVKGAGTAGSQIKTYESLIKYQKKAEEQGKTQSETYKEIIKYIKEVEAEEKKRTATLQTQTNTLDKQKQLKKETEKQLKELAEKPVDSSEFTEEQKKLIQEINTLYAKLIQLKGEATDITKKGKEEQKSFNESNEKTTEDVREQNNEFKKQDGVIGKAVKNFASYTLVLGTMKRALRSAIQTIKVLDKSLTEQAMVAGRSRKELQGLLKDYQNIAKATGATTKEVAEVATQYFRQGKSAKEAMILTEAAVSAAKVGAISTAESVDYLTTAINGFGMAAEDASRVSDRFSALAASSATSYEELAVALSKVAAQAHLAEMSMDFTLGLLAKGIETTREAPETIGTALKTVIARMREMTDYGKTLEDGVSVNNLEEQLKYVGIQLRDNNGELRSSEVVLDEVGKSWDSFSKNQQAALAKAFAGTRQQSRFIAMMQDYDRTLELVNISQESSGATMAQMSTYMQGMEAALNNISVGWETLITTFVKSDFIVGILSQIGDFLNEIGDFFTDQEEGQERVKGTIIAITALLSAMFLNMAGARLQEKIDRKETLRLQQQQVMSDLEAQKQALLQNAINKKNLTLEQARTREKDAQVHLERAANLEKQGQHEAALRQQRLAHEASDEAAKIRQLAEETYEIESAEVGASKEMQEIEKRISEEKLAQSKITQHIAGFAGLYNAAIQVGNAFEVIKLKILKKQTREIQKQEAIKKMSNPVKALIGAGVGLAVAGVAAAGVAIAKAVKRNDPEFQKKERQKEIKEDNAEIYKLTQQKTKIEAATTAYDRYSNSVLKTKEQQEEINRQLDAAADVLTDEQKAEYALLQTEKERANYLKGVEENKEKELNNKRKDQRKRINSIKDLSKEMDENIETKHAVQDLISHDIQLDGVSNENKAKIKNIIDSQIANMSSKDLERLYKTQDYSSFKSAAKILDQKIAGTTDSVLDIFTSGTLQEQARAYNEVLKNASAGTRKIIDTEFGNIAQIAQNFDEETIEVFGKKGFNLEEIQKQFTKLQKLMGKDFSLKNFAELMKSDDKLSYLQKLKKDVDVVAAGGILQDLIYGPKGSEEQTAQDITRFENEIKSLYENQAKWSTMSAEEQRKFIEEHPNFFSNEEAYKKFVSGQDISKDMEIYMKERENGILSSIEMEIESYDLILRTSKNAAEKELAAVKKAEALKRKEYIKTGKVYEQTLELRLKKEEDAIKIFKDILKKHQQALIDSLNKEKEAYQKYYDDINKVTRDQDYEEKRQEINENLLKVSVGLDAQSSSLRAELEQQLKDLEKSRLEELRQKSQDAVIKNIDKQIEDAQDKLKDIEENSAGILKIIENQQSAADVIKLGAIDILTDKNKTDLEKENELNKLLSQTNPLLLEKGLSINEDSFKITNDGKTLVFEVNNERKEMDLDQESQDNLWLVVEQVLRSLGIQ